MKNNEKTYIKDKVSGIYESEELNEKVIAELDKEIEDPEKQDEIIESNIQERKPDFEK